MPIVRVIEEPGAGVLSIMDFSLPEVLFTEEQRFEAFCSGLGLINFVARIRTSLVLRQRLRRDYRLLENFNRNSNLYD